MAGSDFSPDLQARGLLHRYSLDPEILDMPLVLEGGIVRSRSALRLTPHWHGGYELHHVATGRLRFQTADGEDLRVRGGEICLTRPGLRHWGRDGGQEPGDLLWLVLRPGDPAALRHAPFDAEGLAACEGVLMGMRGVRPATAALARLHGELAGLLADEGEGPLYRARLRALVGQVVLEFLASAAGAGRGPEAADRERIDQALALMRQRLADPPAVGELARRAGLSSSRFHALFRAVTGQTPADALRRERIEAAAEALRSDTTVQEVARRLGFSSPQHLATAFRRQYGCSPQVWRTRPDRITRRQGAAGAGRPDAP